MYEMKYLTVQDMPYFRRLAESGKAVIIELSDQALFQVDAAGFRKPSGEINRIILEAVLKEQEPVLQEKCKKGQQLTQEIEEMEKLLEKPDSVDTGLNPARGEAEIPEEQMKKIIEALIRNCLHEMSAERKQV